MLVSVFTPSHDPTWLPEVWACLKAQTYENWEWVVVPNGEGMDRVRAVVEQLTEGDPRVVIEPSDGGGIGFLKRFACEHSHGDLLMEYDHDDLITDDCIEAVVDAAKKLPKACFIYSDDVTLNEDLTSCCFIKEFGWEHYEWEYKGNTYHVNRQFDVHPRSICEILYAPDHVRVWSREAYKIVGGHNRDLSMCDDHDIMIRTYLAGIPFEHIRRPLYIHRLRKNNTCIPNVGKIQEMSRNNRDKYLHALVKEWCRREKLPMYDLGGAHNCPPGYTPIDMSPAVLKAGGIQLDVLDGGKEGGLNRFPDNSVGCFRAFDFLEHIPPEKVVFLMNKLYDKLVPGGWLLTMTPAVCDDDGRCGRGAYQDPTHVSFWSSNNTWYFSKKTHAKFVPEIRCRFQTVRLNNGYPSEWHREHLIPYVTWDAAAIKPGVYWPGPVEI